MSVNVPSDNTFVHMPSIGGGKKKSGKPIRSVFLVRHGIRSPKESVAALRQWSTRAWPTWPGNQGDLTERGKELIQAQWAALKPFLVGNGLIPENGLPKAGEYALIVDATGLVGRHVLEKALANTGIESIVAPGRRALVSHPKLFPPIVDFIRLPEAEER